MKCFSSSRIIPNAPPPSCSIRWFCVICLIVYAVASTLMCIYLIADNNSMMKNDYSTNNTTFQEIERRVRDLSVMEGGVKVACRPIPREELRKKLGTAFIPRYMSEDEPQVEDSNAIIIEESRIQNDKKIKTRKQPALPFFVDSEFSRILFDDPVATSSEVANVLPILEDGDKFNKLEVKIHKETSNKNKLHHHRHNHGNVNKTKELDNFERKKPDESKLLDTDFEQSEPAEPDVVETGFFKNEEISQKFIKIVIPDDKRSKRSAAGSGMPFHCESEIVWLDLGPGYFPRFLRSVKCKQARCWWRHFQCQPKAFTVKVLRRIKDTCIEKLMSGEGPTLYENGLVPGELSEQWMLEEKAVTFCCECGM